MRKRLLYGLICVAACVLGFLGILYAQDGPNFEIQVPYAGQVIEGPKMPITVVFRNSDKVPVVRFDVAIDGTRFFGGAFRNPSTSGSFESVDQCDIARTKVVPGTHTITIRLTDAQGRISERAQVIDYEPLNVRPVERNAPKVRIVKPVDGAMVNAETDVCVESSDDTELKLVKVFVDGQMYALTNKESFSFVWDPIKEKVSSGSHTLSASAWDIFDNQGDSLPVMVLVSNQYLPEGGNGTRIEKSEPNVVMTPVTLIPIVAPQIALNTRLPITGITPNMTAVLPGLAMPNLYGDLSRSNVYPSANGGMLAIIPQKAQPGNGMAMIAPLASIGQGRLNVGASLLGPKPVALILPREALGSSQVMALLPANDKSLPKLSEGTTTRTPIVNSPEQRASTSASTSIDKQQPMNTPVTVLVPGDVTTIPVQANALIPQGKVSNTRIDAPGIALVGPDGQQVPTTATVITGRQEIANTPTMIATVPVSKGTPASTVPSASIDTALVNAVVNVPAKIEQPKPSGALNAPRTETPKVSDSAVVANTHLPATTVPGRTAVSAPVINTDVQVGKSGPASSKIVPDVKVNITPAPAKRVTTSTKTINTPAVNVSATSSNPLMRLTGKYTVQDGDTLAKIARAYSTTAGEIAKLNPTLDADHLVAGRRINVPRQGTHISLDDENLIAKPAPYIAGAGYTMVPFRTMVQEKGGVIVWIPRTREVNAWVNNNFMGVTIGKRAARINSEVYVLPVAAVIQDSRTIVPLRFVAKGMDLVLEYDPATKSSALTSKSSK